MDDPKTTGCILALALGGSTRLGWAARFVDGRTGSGLLNVLRSPAASGQRYLRLRFWLRAFDVGAGGLEAVWAQRLAPTWPRAAGLILTGRRGLAAERALGAYEATVAAWCAGRGVAFRLVEAAELDPSGDAEALAFAILGAALDDAGIDWRRRMP